MTGRLRVALAWTFVLAFLALATPTTAPLVVGAGLSVAGLAVRTWAVGWLDKGSGLATRGPYAHTRNPLYLGSFVIGVGFGVAGGHWAWPIAFAVFFAAVYVPTVRREATELTERYGDRYAAYAAHVPVFALRLTPYRPAAGEGHSSPDRFRWSRYLRYREWEAPLGVAAVLLVLVLKIRLAA